jgi:Family of unknown function (DUF6161)
MTTPRQPEKSSSPSDRQQFVEWLNDFLNAEEQNFKGLNAHDLAMGLATQQAGRWQRLLTIFDVIQRNPGISTVVGHLRQVILGNMPTPTVNKIDNYFVVSSKLPLIRSDVPKEKIEQGQTYPLLAAGILISRCGKKLLESHDQEAARLLVMSSIAESNLILKTEDQLLKPAWDAVDSQLSITQGRVDSFLSEAKERMAILERVLAASQETLSKAMSETNNVKAESERAIAEARQHEAAREMAWKRERETALIALRSEVAEFSKVETSINLWRTKANWHTFNYIALGVVFGGSLLGTAYIIIFGRMADFISELTNIPADHQFLGIALLTIPTLAVAWFLRFVARLAIQNLSLAHDAQQRHAQINTYLRLLGDASKPISEKERILALAALFRPLPGQGTDDVNPPTIADLLKDALEQVPKPR